MSVNTDIKWEAKKVKELGEQIGYGNMMWLASALWRKMLVEKGAGTSGAFVPCLFNIKDKNMVKECQRHDEIVADI